MRSARGRQTPPPRERHGTSEINLIALTNGAARKKQVVETLCPIGVKGSRVLRHRHRGSSPTIPALMETRAPPPGSRFGRMIPATGEEINKREVVKGYEYTRGEFVTFTAEELKALDVESSKVIDLEKFVPRGDIDSVYSTVPITSIPMARSPWRRSG